MINWIIGGIIIGFTIYVIVKRVIALKKGDSSCHGCSSKKDGCDGCK